MLLFALCVFLRDYQQVLLYPFRAHVRHVAASRAGAYEQSYHAAVVSELRCGVPDAAQFVVGEDAIAWNIF